MNNTADINLCLTHNIKVASRLLKNAASTVIKRCRCDGTGDGNAMFCSVESYLVKLVENLTLGVSLIC